MITINRKAAIITIIAITISLFGVKFQTQGASGRSPFLILGKPAGSNMTAGANTTTGSNTTGAAGNTTAAHGTSIPTTHPAGLAPGITCKRHTPNGGNGACT